MKRPDILLAVRRIEVASERDPRRIDAIVQEIVEGGEDWRCGRQLAARREERGS